MVNARNTHGNGRTVVSPQAQTENPNGVQSFSPGLPRVAAATLGYISQNPTANFEAARSAKFICGYPIGLIRPIPPHHPSTHPHPKSTVDLEFEPLIRVENGLLPPLPPTCYRPIIRPENKGIKPKSNRHKPKNFISGRPPFPLFYQKSLCLCVSVAKKKSLFCSFPRSIPSRLVPPSPT